MAKKLQIQNKIFSELRKLIYSDWASNCLFICWSQLSQPSQPSQLSQLSRPPGPVPNYIQEFNIKNVWISLGYHLVTHCGLFAKSFNYSRISERSVGFLLLDLRITMIDKYDMKTTNMILLGIKSNKQKTLLIFNIYI